MVFRKSKSEIFSPKTWQPSSWSASGFKTTYGKIRGRRPQATSTFFFEIPYSGPAKKSARAQSARVSLSSTSEDRFPVSSSSDLSSSKLQPPKASLNAKSKKKTSRNQKVAMLMVPPSPTKDMLQPQQSRDSASSLSQMSSNQSGGSGASCSTGNSNNANSVSGHSDEEMKGWLYKWTNYLKGYQKRWFVLKSGTLSYYRNQAEVGQLCRGAIGLQGAFLHTEDSCKFIVSNGGSQNYHLKANSEVERQRWVTALELARVRAIKAAESDEDEEYKLDQEDIQPERGEIQQVVRTLQAKIEDLTTCQDLISKHGQSFQKALLELEDLQNCPDPSLKMKSAMERATLFRITTHATINACSEFVKLAETQGNKWARMLKHEREHRVRLQDTLEQLARQHTALERAAFIEAQEHGPLPTHPSVLSSDEETEFHDAQEEMEDEVYNLPRHRASKKHARLEDEGEESGKSAGSPEAPSEGLLLDADIVTRKSESELGDIRTQKAASDEISIHEGVVARRKRIPPKPEAGVNLWSIMKNCIGKELSKIPMPVNFNEPLSMLQRLTEDLEYSHILDCAAECEDSCEQMAYVAAFTISSYSTTVVRTGKPYNPLLGETFECDRTDDKGWRSVCEQVSHHPPAAAMYTEGRGWTLWQEFTMSSKFRGKYLQIIPLGISHLEFKGSGNHYTWRKVTTTVHNIIVGRLWIDNHGDMSIENHKTGDKCHLKYVPYSYFSRDTPRKVNGIIADPSGQVRWVVCGTWDEYVDCAKVASTQNTGGKPVFETHAPKLLWKRNPTLPGSDKFYFFTKFAVELNEPEPGVAPTDSRLRPDQRKMEEGDFKIANEEKLRLEEKQRMTRRLREAEAEQAIQEGRPYQQHEALWFKKQKDPWTNNLIHMYTGEYWDHKAKGDWSMCPDIY